MMKIDVNGSLQSVFDDPACPQVLRQTLAGALSWQVRNETSVRKALASPRIAPQWVAALLALGATVVTEDGEVSLAEADIAEARTLQVSLAGVRWGEAHVARTLADEPIVTAIAAVHLEDDVVQEARIALTGVWSEVVCLAEAAAQLVGGPLDAERIQAVAQAVQAEVEPKGDFRGSEEYRRAMAGVLTRRALEACLGQEVGNE
jgi:CO/xanthine dehydrogenase FAD-binding subunit